MPYYIKVDNGGTVVDFSMVSMSFNIGMFIGGITTALKKNWKHKMRIIYIAYIIMGIGNILIASVPKGHIILIVFFSPITGFAIPFINSLYFTLIHLRVPQDKVGRVLSIDTSLSFIAIPIGTLLAGPLANIMGTANLFLTSAILSMIIISLFYILTNMRSLGVIKEIENQENSSLGKIE
jgi:DHA3 family macrolide efflux protein-like MFS transporter